MGLEKTLSQIQAGFLIISKNPAQKLVCLLPSLADFLQDSLLRNMCDAQKDPS